MALCLTHRRCAQTKSDSTALASEHEPRTMFGCTPDTYTLALLRAWPFAASDSANTADILGVIRRLHNAS